MSSSSRAPAPPRPTQRQHSEEHVLCQGQIQACTIFAYLSLHLCFFDALGKDIGSIAPLLPWSLDSADPALLWPCFVLQVLSFVSNDGRSDGSLPVDAAACAELRVLGCELSAAAASTTLLAELSRLEGIYLHGRGVVRPEVLEPVLTVLRTLPGLRLVLVNQKLAEGLGGYKVPSSSSPYSTRAWVAQQLPLREVASRRALDAWQELLPGKEVVVMEMWPEDGAQLGTFLSLRPPLSWDEVE